MKEWKESALCQAPSSALCMNCLGKWRNGSIEMAERAVLPWPVSFPCETLCGSGLLATALLLTLLLSFPPSRVGIDAEHLARYLRVRTPIHLYLSPTQVWPRVLHSISTHDCDKIKKKHLREDKLGLPWWFGGYKSTCQCRELHPWPGKWFSQPRDYTHISCLARGLFTTESPRKPYVCYSG